MQKYCKSKFEIQKQISRDNEDVESQDDFDDLSLMKDSKKSKSMQNEAELAQLALEIYGKKSSVLYDLASITDLIQQ